MAEPDIERKALLEENRKLHERIAELESALGSTDAELRRR